MNPDMARATPKRCRQRACGNSTTNRHGYCSVHASNAGWGKYGKQQSAKGNRIHHSSEWKRLSPHVKQLAGYLCINHLLMSPSQVVGGDMITEHIVPVSKGGSNALSNLSCFCTECAKTKTAWERNKSVNEVLRRYGHTAITLYKGVGG